MLSWLFGTDSLMELFATPSFWIGVAITVIIIAVLVVSIKNWSAGGKYIFGGLFVFINVFISAYSFIELNYYYSAKGGIHGVITGIFNTNEVQIVDNIVFEFKNIELTETSSGIYSATITTSEVLDLDGKENIGVFINDLPCSYVEYAGDYVSANYVYTFLDEDKSILCTDTLKMRFAFYDNSTMLSISTEGGSEAVKYWHYYINKNDFKVSIGESDYIVSGDIEYSDGDTSEWCVVTYVVGENVVCTQACKINTTIAFPVLDIKHGSWTINEEEITEDYVVTENVTIYAREIIENTATFMLGSEIYATKVVETETCVTGVESSFEYEESQGTYVVVNGWLLDGNVVDLTTQKITSDVTFVADYHKEHLVTVTNIAYIADERIVEGTCLDIEIPEYYVLEYYKICDYFDNSNLITTTTDLSTYPITQPLWIVPVGEYFYPVEYVVSETNINSQVIERGELSVVPNNPELVGKEFLGWSLDGRTIVDPVGYKIYEPTRFIAVFNDTEYILTLEYYDTENNLVTDTIVGNYLDTYTLPIPSLEGYTFNKWVIEEGVGSIENGVFTFGVGDCKVIPTWNEISVYVTIPTILLSSVDFGDYEVIDTSVSSTQGTTFYELVSDRSGSISFTLNDTRPYDIKVTTDGEYDLIQNGLNYTLSWTDCNQLILMVSIKTSGVL